jgi:hypothetical protein
VLKEILCIVVTLFIFFLMSSQTLYAINTGNSVIFPPDSKPYRLSNEQHIKNFWKWIISFPKDKNPWNDPTGANCDNGQSQTNSSVFYLSGNGGGISVRKCNVPVGKSLFIPVSPMEISDKEAPKSSVGDLSKIAKKDQDSITSLYLKIDNKEFSRQDLSKYRTHTEPFFVVFPKNAIFGVTEGSSKAVADGYYVITEPLAKGPHTIQFKSSLICPGTDCIQPNFAQDIKYNLVVQ